MSTNQAIEYIQSVRESGKPLHELPLTAKLQMVIVDRNFELRWQVAQSLYQSYSLPDRPLIHFIFEQALGTAQWSPMQGVPLDLKLCVIMLYRLKQAEDSSLIWKAKLANYDTVTLIDGQFLVGAGVVDTLEYLRSSGELSQLPTLLIDGQQLSVTDYIETSPELGQIETIEGLEGSILNFEADNL